MLFKVRKTMMSTAVCCSVIFGASQTVCADQTELGRTVPDYLWHNGFEYYVFKNESTDGTLNAEGYSSHEGGFRLALKYLGSGQYRQTAEYTSTENDTVTLEKAGDTPYIAFRNAKGELHDVLIPADRETGFNSQLIRNVAQYLSGSYTAVKDGAMLVIKPAGNGIEITYDGETVNAELMSDSFDDYHPAFKYNGKNCYGKVTEKGLEFQIFTGELDEYLEKKSAKEKIEFKANDQYEPRFAGLSEQIYSLGYFMQYDSNMLKIIRNEIFARHGHVFKNMKLADYFGSKDWYRELNGKAETALTPVEQFNVKMIAITEKYLQDEKNSR